MEVATVTIYDTGDRRSYDLDMTQGDILAILNMRAFGKRTVELPSLQGSASLSGRDLLICYKHRHGTGTIGVDITVLQPILEKAFQSFH